MASTKMFTKNPHAQNTSSTSFFHQQQGPSSTTIQNMDEDTTLTQEMHVKMAKKIAQLTKVSFLKGRLLFISFLIYYLQISEKKRAPRLQQTYTLCSKNKA
ncbi:unnamed protein product [Rotaria magnacalcarata]|uniref:Uncharacterized protein n=1 Tax=Rotaria magnacalcarata TaxID=392030 RepID=A0A816QW60_9BILA|nr:unnamed protein product [Rotaria magnacalcarata]CAF1509380.1 unnamed protein product [Rotaria magnacalcarata]CAF2063831.1 unnamed protein product [Rotaria magnacalcarata]CAF3932759.1 unnamed protein product [Rotaria magnacalcarata]CAF4094157.1 unnamed protein product [Rotaria magnacalcarata]